MCEGVRDAAAAGGREGIRMCEGMWRVCGGCVEGV